MRIPVIAIFDIGKTNKKLFLFDEHYRVRDEMAKQLAEIPDPDGFPCEDIEALQEWMKHSLQSVLQQPHFELKAVNFSGYGASFVHLNGQGIPVSPLYNYLKPYPKALRDKFYTTYGGEENFCLTTASPALGHLNSGMQLYWLKHEHPEIFA
jgi:L-fuculokinase